MSRVVSRGAAAEGGTFGLVVQACIQLCGVRRYQERVGACNVKARQRVVCAAVAPAAHLDRTSSRTWSKADSSSGRASKPWINRTAAATGLIEPSALYSNVSVCVWGVWERGKAFACKPRVALRPVKQD